MASFIILFACSKCKELHEYLAGPCEGLLLLLDCHSWCESLLPGSKGVRQQLHTLGLLFWAEESGIVSFCAPFNDDILVQCINAA